MLFLFLIIVSTPKLFQAAELPEVITLKNSIITKTQEGIEYFFAFGTEKKVAILKTHAEKRLTATQTQAKPGNNEKAKDPV
ncbi:MAG: hypothetical protein PHX72_03165 [Candidatus Shapirobacteria bacterium]|nr:hypothetical protein [Candidatus Shapirobacteria bacterium]